MTFSISARKDGTLVIFLIGEPTLTILLCATISPSCLTKSGKATWVMESPSDLSTYVSLDVKEGLENVSTQIKKSLGSIRVQNRALLITKLAALLKSPSPALKLKLSYWSWPI